MRPFADGVVDTSEGSPEELAALAADLIDQELVVRCHAANTYGDVVRVTSFGESHGRAIGCIVEGLHPDIEISEEVIQKQMERSSRNSPRPDRSAPMPT